ncbi:MAG: acetylxylan esterase, partial [Gemmatimonadota bacterium]
DGVRAAVLDTFLRGHPAGLLEAAPAVVWGEAIPRDGYRIRKLRYEGYPGLWVPALLSEPTGARGPLPAVLNPNGHHAGGKAMDYKQARCINLVRRGMLALNTEFIGMGELRGDLDHNRIAHLDLCGVAGVGVFYLAMKRGLDVLLAHRRTDPERVAMTGLSGGGWQTALLSALDERITTVVPVAGHSPVWCRVRHNSDIGDQEQVPSDLCAAADYDVLTGLFAPRPTLLIYNHDDDCCFQTRRTRKSVYRPAREVYELLGVADRLGFHDNLDPGTHNYELDNRQQLYRFLNRHFHLDGPDAELPWRDDLLPESRLNVGLPPENATLLTLARDARQRLAGARRSRPRRDRPRLAALLHLPRYARVQAHDAGGPQRRGEIIIRQRVLSLASAAKGADTWSIAVTEVAPARPRDLTVVIGDAGRAGLIAAAQQAARGGHRVLAADLFGTGESAVSWQHHMILASTGERSLGIQVAQLLALLAWARERFHRAPHLQAHGQVTATMALVATALQPRAAASLVTGGALDSLGRLIDWPVPYAGAAPLFCFGLLAEFDVADFLALSAPLPVSESGRGPFR